MVATQSRSLLLTRRVGPDLSDPEKVEDGAPSVARAHGVRGDEKPAAKRQTPRPSPSDAGQRPVASERKAVVSVDHSASE